MRDMDLFLGSSITGSLMLASVIPSFLLGLAIPYAILRIREDKTSDPDPQLGVKAGLHYFISLGMLLALFGLTIIVIDLMMGEDAGRRNRGDEISFAVRAGFALMLSGGLFVIVHVFCLPGTNDRSRPMARRAFLGARMAVHGLVVLIALSTLLVLLMQKGTTFKQVKPLLAILLIWTPSWIVHLGLLVSGTPRLIRPRLDDD